MQKFNIGDIVGVGEIRLKILERNNWDYKVINLKTKSILNYQISLLESLCHLYKKGNIKSHPLTDIFKNK